ncbi:MAG: YIP1 family protein [Pseudomonadota bacterium]
MNWTVNGIVSMIGASLTRPRSAAEALLARPISVGDAMAALGVSIIGSVMLSFFLSGGAPIPLLLNVPPFGPFMLALFTISMTTIFAVAVHLVGRAMGGQGDLAGAILVMAWIQVLQLAAQVIFAFVTLVDPTLGSMLGFLVTLGLIWVLLSFLDVLHSLGGLGRAAFLLLMVVVGIALGLGFILTLIGVGST